MQTLYIFGNGFDMAHGIKTPYSAFREFLRKNHESFLTTFESMYSIQPLDDTEPWYTEEAQERWDKKVIDDLWWSFEEKMGHPDVEGMYDSAYSMVDTMPTEGIIDTMNVYWREQYGFVDKLQKYVLKWLQTIDPSQSTCKKDSLINNRTEEKLLEAETDFADSDSDWMTRLKYQPRTDLLENSVYNLNLILNNDPDFQNFAFNELANRIQITGPLPWERPEGNSFWRDADTAQLKSIIDIRYLAFSSRNHDVAFTKAADMKLFVKIWWQRLRMKKLMLPM